MADSEKPIESLFDGLRPRPEPPPAARARAFAAAAAELRSRRRYRQRAMLAAMAMAAGLLLAVTIGLQTGPASAGFSVELADAPALDLDGRQPASGTDLVRVKAGTVMHAQAPARLALGATTDLRLNANTTIRWRGEREFELEAGSVFVDTNGADGMRVHTAQGTVTDIGTRFLVTFANDELEIAMRSGRTLLESTLGRFEASADGLHGDVLNVSTAGVQTSVEPTDAERWSWISAVPRGYGESRVAALLQQIAADLGRRVVYVDRGAEAWVTNLKLQGEQLDRLTPEQAIEVVAATAGLVIAKAPGRELRVALP